MLPGPKAPGGVQVQWHGGGFRRQSPLKHGSFRTEFKPISRHLKSVRYFLIQSSGADYDMRMHCGSQLEAV